MNATEDFTIAVNKDGFRVPYRVGVTYKNLTFIHVRKGNEIPTKFLKNIIEHNIELVDVKYKFRKPINLPNGMDISQPEISKTMKINRRKYSQESLTKLYNEKGFSALKEIGKEFGVTDRSYRRLINEILTAQETKQRTG